jgi:hypothetical protein
LQPFNLSFLQKFNTKTTQLVLNGGAVVKGTLKTIFAKHLAVTATSLRAISSLLPASQHTMLKDLWRVGQDLDMHVERIFDKFSAILQDTFSVSLENIGSVDWNQHVTAFDDVYPRLVKDAVQLGLPFVTSVPSEAALTRAKESTGPVWGGDFVPLSARPSEHMRVVIKNTETLHRIIASSLSAADLCHVFSTVAVMLSAQLPVIVVSAQYNALSRAQAKDGALSDEGLSDYGCKRLAWDVIMLLVMLRQVPGLGLQPAGALAHDDVTAGQVALGSIESWLKRQFGVVLSPALYTAFGQEGPSNQPGEFDAAASNLPGAVDAATSSQPDAEEDATQHTLTSSANL